MGARVLLVTGSKGQLGRALLDRAAARGMPAAGVDVDEMPLEQRAAIHAVIRREAPSFVLHCGAITNVDGCEGEPLAAYRVNGLATAWVAEAAAAAGAGVLYVSTDFVFDGMAAGVPYAVDAPPRPLSVYGASKRLGEEAVLAHGRADFAVIRTSWVFGPGGRNFPRAILDRARSGQPLRVVTDQIGRPTLTLDLADAMLDLVALGPEGGIYHAANEGACSWHEFAAETLRAAGLADVAIGQQRSADLARPAARPAWSVLDTTRLDQRRGRPMPHYEDALRRYLAIEDAGAPPPDAGGATLGGKQY